MVSPKLISFVAIGVALSMVAAAPVTHVGENGSSLLNQVKLFALYTLILFF